MPLTKLMEVWNALQQGQLIGLARLVCIMFMLLSEGLLVAVEEEQVAVRVVVHLIQAKVMAVQEAVAVEAAHLVLLEEQLYLWPV